MTLDERDLRRPNDVDDERLGQKGFDKPSGLKQRRIVPSIEEIEHHAVGRIQLATAYRSGFSFPPRRGA
jgi:hypothetical protein